MNSTSKNEARRCQPHLGTYIDIWIHHPDPKKIHSTLDNAFAIIQHIHKKMSRHDPESDLYKKDTIDPMTQEVFEIAEKLREKSNGIFNIHQPEGITLDGIAKGYAVDKALEILKKSGATSGFVNAGGDMGCFGQPHPVHLRHDQEIAPLTILQNEALAASQKNHITVAVQAPNCTTADALTKIVMSQAKNTQDVLDYFKASAWILERTQNEI
jgi:thiamine biosynthesis lipoprotein